jgi:hypothetical protein
MSNLTTDQMAEIIIRSARETAKEFARKRRKISGKGKKAETLSRNVSPAPARSRKFERNA